MGFYSDTVKAIIQEWKKEARVTSTVLYKLSSFHDDKFPEYNMKLTIATNRPGPLIGLHGSTVDKYREKLENSFISKNKKIMVNFIETDGIA